jgi:AraC family transcriptional regulator
MLCLGDVETDFRWHGPGLLLPERPCNFLVRMHTREASFPDHDGYLSVKLVSGGREEYTLDRRTVAVDDEHYFVLNHGQRYASQVSQPHCLESLAIFFDPAYAADILATLSTTLDRLLELPLVVDQPVHFFDRLYESDPRLSGQVSELRRRLSAGTATPDWLSEWFPAVLEHLLFVHRGLRADIDSLDAVRLATRTELYRRLCWGRDFIETCFDQPVTVAKAADAACLSRYRFLRLFAQAFGITPHRFLTDRRLRAARGLLRNTEMPVTDVCLSVGFDSLGSFSALFKKRYGVPPSAWRREVRMSA